MQKFTTIKRLTFGAANYYLSDGGHDRVVLHVEYDANKYQLKSRDGAVPNPRFRRDIEQLAADLLRRKHGVNFAAQVRNG